MRLFQLLIVAFSLASGGALPPSHGSCADLAPSIDVLNDLSARNRSASAELTKADAIVHAGSSYEQFVLRVVEALNVRRFGRDSLDIFLDDHATEATGGEWLEFGVARGYTMTKIARRRLAAVGSDTALVHGFDSFQGLPEGWDKYGTGAFDRKGRPPWHSKHVKWHVGWYNTTARQFATELQQRSAPSSSSRLISFMHVDCDLYSATAQIFEELEAYLAPGAFIVFDELVGYPGYRGHEMLALFQMLQRTKRKVRVIGWPGPDLLPVRATGSMNRRAEADEAERKELMTLTRTYNSRHEACTKVFPHKPHRSSFDYKAPLQPQEFSPAKSSHCAAPVAASVNGVSGGCWPATRPFEPYTLPLDAIVQVL